MNNTPFEAIFGTKKPDGTYIGRLVIEPVQLVETVGGFAMPEVDQQKDKPEVGRVIMKSEEVTHLSEGDIVLHGRFAGNKFTHDGKEYLVIHADEAYARLDKDKITICK